MRIRDPGWKKVGSWILDKHPGSATLHVRYYGTIQNKTDLQWGLVEALLEEREGRRVRILPHSRGGVRAGGGVRKSLGNASIRKQSNQNQEVRYRYHFQSCGSGSGFNISSESGYRYWYNPIRIQGFDDPKNWRKNQKLQFTYVQATGEAFSPQKRTSSTSTDTPLRYLLMTFTGGFDTIGFSSSSSTFIDKYS